MLRKFKSMAGALMLLGSILGTPALSAVDNAERAPVEVRDIYHPGLFDITASLRAKLNAPGLEAPEKIDLLLKISAIEFAAEDYAASAKHLGQILKLNPDKATEISVQQHLGSCSYALGNYQQADKYFLSAFEMVQRENLSGTPLERAVLCDRIGCLSKQQGKSDQLLELLKRQLALAQAAHDKVTEGWVHVALADLMHAAGKEDDAIAQFKSACALFKQQIADERIHVPPPASTDLWTVIEAGPAHAPAKSWQAAHPFAVLLCVHGLGLHSGYYQGLGEALAARGITVVAMDVRGFGAWAKTRGLDDIDLPGAVRDTSYTLRALREMNPGLPIFLLGESMGGAIALQTSAAHPGLADGVISSVPSAERYNQFHTLGRVVWHMVVDGNKEYDVAPDVVARVSTKEKLREEWEHDRLARFKMPPTQLVKFDTFMKQNMRTANEIKGPVLVVQGDSDRLVKADSTIKLFRAIGSPDRNLLLIGSGEHLVFEAGQFSPVLLAGLFSWMSSQPNAKKLVEAVDSPAAP